MAKKTSKIEGAIVGLSVEESKEFVLQLSTVLKNDKTQMASFKKDPNVFLSNRGLNIDLRREILTGSEFSSSAKVNWCLKTCWCTDCCITEINITNSTPKN